MIRLSSYFRLQVSLIEFGKLGIELDMHLDRSYDEFMANPVLAAEYLASQLYRAVTKPKIDTVSALRIIQEHNALENSQNIAMLSSERIPRKALELAVEQALLGFIEYNFNISEEEYNLS